MYFRFFYLCMCMRAAHREIAHVRNKVRTISKSFLDLSLYVGDII